MPDNLSRLWESDFNRYVILALFAGYLKFGLFKHPCTWRQLGQDQGQKRAKCREHIDISRPMPKMGIYDFGVIMTQLLKILEKIIGVKIVSHLEDNILNQNQRGFCRFWSCLSHLVEHYDNIIEAASEGNNLEVIYLDYSKAFDVVNHHILLQ